MQSLIEKIKKWKAQCSSFEQQITKQPMGQWIAQTFEDMPVMIVLILHICLPVLLLLSICSFYWASNVYIFTLAGCKTHYVPNPMISHNGVQHTYPPIAMRWLIFYRIFIICALTTDTLIHILEWLFPFIPFSTYYLAKVFVFWYLAHDISRQNRKRRMSAPTSSQREKEEEKKTNVILEEEELRYKQDKSLLTPKE